MRLSREIRFALVARPVTERAPTNSWAGWPATNLIAPQLTLRCVIEGMVDPATGYLCNIKVIDEVLRSIVQENLIPSVTDNLTPETALKIVDEQLRARWRHPAKVVEIHLTVSPYILYSLHPLKIRQDTSMDSESATSHDTSNDAKTRLFLTEQFEFSAAHRLHCFKLSGQENRALFGKCNNPAGHGHNYVVEVTVSRDVGPTGQVVEIHEFESAVKRLVVDRLDHKHLNEDVDYFADINPTVENIVVAIYEWLDGQLGDATLEKVKLYETPKTWAEYGGST